MENEIPNGAMSETSGNDWEGLTRDLQAECDKLRGELAIANEKLGSYRQLVSHLLPIPEFNFTEDELDALFREQPTFRDCIEELKSDPAFGQGP